MRTNETVTPYGGLPPFVAGSDISETAAVSVAETASTMRQRVLRYIHHCCFIGATCDEVEVALGMAHQTASARIRELAQMELIEDTGDRRKTRSGRSARIYRTPVHKPTEAS